MNKPGRRDDDHDIAFLATIAKHPERLGPNITVLIKRYYGLDGYHVHTFRELAEHYSRSPELMRMVLSRAMRRVKHPDVDDLSPFEWPKKPPVAKDWYTIHRKKPKELRALIVRARRLKPDCYPALWVE